MSSILRAISKVWENSPELCEAVPFARVFTGRIPAAAIYRFPYVSIISTGGHRIHRTNRSHYHSSVVSFHIWVDDAKLESGIQIAELLAKTLSSRCYSLGGGDTIIDILDEGEASINQVDIPTFKAWEVIQLFSVRTMRTRTDYVEVASSEECCENPPNADSESSTSVSSASAYPASSVSSSSSTSTP